MKYIKKDIKYNKYIKKIIMEIFVLSVCNAVPVTDNLEQ